MKNIKHIRDAYDTILESESVEERKFTALVRAGLFDAKKLQFIKRALNKDVKDLTLSERKMLIELLNTLMSEVLHSQQVYAKVKQNVAQRDLHEDQKYFSGYLSKFDTRTKEVTDRDIPTVLILKRKAIRVFPDRQKVALYYSQALDKYVSIPFTGINASIDESITYNDASSDENVETSPATQILQNLNITESFKRRLQEKRKSLNEGAAADVADIATDLIPGVSNVKSAYNAAKAAKEGNYGQAALHGVLALPGIGNIGKGIKSVAKGASLAKKISTPVSKGIQKVSPNAVVNKGGFGKTGDAIKSSSTQPKQSPTVPYVPKSKDTSVGPWGPRNPGKPNKSADKSGTKGKGGKRDKGGNIRNMGVDVADTQTSSSPTERTFSRPKDFSLQVNTYGSKGGTKADNAESPSDKIRRERERQLNFKMMQQNEDVLQSINMIVENPQDEYTLNINGKNITISNTIAEKILHVYNAVNENNQQVMHRMLNEDVESFKRIVNFALRQ